jgi:hypothetical protein
MVLDYYAQLTVRYIHLLLQDMALTTSVRPPFLLSLFHSFHMPKA